MRRKLSSGVSFAHVVRPVFRHSVQSGHWLRRYSSHISYSSPSSSSVLSWNTHPDNKSQPPTKPIVITTPIFYVNSSPHLGHLFSVLLADGLARWYRILNARVLFVTGTDEHGIKVYQAANFLTGSTSGEVANKDVLKFCDATSGQFRSAFEDYDIAFDQFIRTTEPRHITAVKKFWNLLRDSGNLYLGKYAGWYSISDETFVPKSSVYSPTGDPNDNIFAESGSKVVWIEEDNWKFKMNLFIDTIAEKIQSGELTIKPEFRRNEVLSLLNGRDSSESELSVSRLRNKNVWGIPVPDDEERSLIYVWVDALLNYLTACGFPDESFKEIWPADYQIVGKDILKFHSVYFPALLLAAGIKELPKLQVAHGHWKLNGTKMSKSKGNVVNLQTLKENFGKDVVRWFLLSENNLKDDFNFEEEQMRLKSNAFLCDSLGNLLSRLSGKLINPANLVESGEVTLSSEEFSGRYTFDPTFTDLPTKVDRLYREVDFVEGLREITCAVHLINKKFNDATPWKLYKDILKKDNVDENLDKLKFCIYESIEVVRVVGLLLQPIIPESCEKLFTMLGVDKSQRSIDYIQWGKGTWHFKANKNGDAPVSVLFPKLLTQK